MARFLVTYYAGDMRSDPASIADARRAFTRWAEQAGPALAEVGAPARSTMTISADGTRDAIAGPLLMGWSVIEAADSDAAVRLVQDHPFISRGGILQIIEPV
jgi:hypothetical protein